MRPRILKLAMLIGLAGLLLMPASPEQACELRPDQLAGNSNLQAGKLRKLHLVRPDLIPYPIFFEVYC